MVETPSAGNDWIQARIGANAQGVAVGKEITQNFGPTPAQFAELVTRTLAWLNAHPQTRSRLVAARGVLQNTRQQLRLLAEYKEVHDQLQQLELCYRVVYTQLYDDGQLLVVEQVRWTAFKQSHRHLCNTIARLCATVAAVSFAGDAAGWRAILLAAGETLRNAYAARDLAAVDLAIYDVNYVLSNQISRMNDQLIGAARAIDLAALAAMLRQLAVALPAEDAETPVARYLAGAAVIEEMAVRLTHLCAEHDRWQGADNELRPLFAALDPRGFPRLWGRGLAPRLRALCADQEEEWAMALRQEIEQVEEAVAAVAQTGLSPLREAVDECRRQVNERLNEVDWQLLRLCQVLKEAGGPLDRLLEGLG